VVALVALVDPFFEGPHAAAIADAPSAVTSDRESARFRDRDDSAPRFDSAGWGSSGRPILTADI